MAEEVFQEEVEEQEVSEGYVEHPVVYEVSHNQDTHDHLVVKQYHNVHKQSYYLALLLLLQDRSFED